MQSWTDDVRRAMASHLNDVFPEIRFHHLHASLFEGSIQVDLFGCHRL
jgi:hypothetical protein